MDHSESEDIKMFMGITGASEGVALEKLQVHGGDLNAALNAFYNEGENPVIPRQTEDASRNDWMEEDEPVQLRPRPVTPPQVRPNLSSWGTLITGPPMISGRGFEGVGQLPTRGTVPLVSHPREVREIPIDWLDEETPAVPHSGPVIEEVPLTDVGQVASVNQGHVIVDDDDDEDLPNTASSIYRVGGETTRGTMFGSATHIRDMPARDINIPVDEGPALANDEGNAIEEEMLRAAIDASKKEAEAASRRRSNYSESAMQTEDDDLARAVSLSLKTAEEERALREQQMIGIDSQKGIMQNEDGDENPFAEDLKMLGSLKRHGSSATIDNTRMETEGQDRILPNSEVKLRNLESRLNAAASSPEETEDLDEQPLLRRRSSRHLNSTTVQAEADSTLIGQEFHTQLESGGTAHLPDNGFSASAPPVPNNDAWGGISSEEQEEAVMLEAAMFGTLPEDAAVRFQYPTVHSDSESYLSGDVTHGFGHPVLPPSPSVVAQRLLREQQDDEYRASLEADREKETKAQLEEEVRRLKESEAAAAAVAAEHQRLKEQEHRLHAEEELERLLAGKKASLPAEPAVDDDGAITLLVRMPDGSRRGRRFQKYEKLQHLFDFIDIGGGVKPGSYRLVRQYPRQTFTDAEHEFSLSDLGLNSKQEALFLELC